jgi:anti-sigma28 factor (negative regulator of flagellin synthesis)
MKNDHPIAVRPAAERTAHAVWEQLLGRLQRAAAAEARLHQVRRAIARGEFQVDARAIAERLIARLLNP